MNKFLLISTFISCITNSLLSQRLDSIHQKTYDTSSSSLYTSYRTLFEYDEDNHPIVKRRYKWQRTEEVWEEVKREHYEHNEKGLLLSRYEENYSSFLGEWLRNDKRSFTYDEKDRRTTRITYFWNKTSKVWYEKLVDSVFYGDGEVLRKTYTLISTDRPLLEISRIRRNYDCQGRLLTRTTLGRQSIDDSWIDEYQTKYEFGGGGQLLSISQIKIGTNNQAIESLIEYTYNSKLKLISVGNYYGSNRFLNYRDDYSYSGDTVTKENWRWDERFNEVVRDYKTIEVLDDSGRVELSTYLGFNLDKKQYVKMDKQTNTYNQFDTIKYFVRETWKSDDWEPMYAYRYFHSQNPISVEHASKTVRVFPNPTTSTIRFSDLDSEPSSCDIYSISGVKVFSTRVQGGCKVHVHSLKPGYYLCRIQSEGETYQVKFLKQ